MQAELRKEEARKPLHPAWLRENPLLGRVPMKRWCAGTTGAMWAVMASSCASTLPEPPPWPSDTPTYATVRLVEPEAGFQRTPLPAEFAQVVRRTVQDALIRRGYHLALPRETPDLLVWEGAGRRTEAATPEGEKDDDLWVFEAYDPNQKEVVWTGYSAPSDPGTKPIDVAGRTREALADFPAATGHVPASTTD